MTQSPKVNGKLEINHIDIKFDDKSLNEVVSILKSFKREFYKKK